MIFFIKNPGQIDMASIINLHALFDSGITTCVCAFDVRVTSLLMSFILMITLQKLCDDVEDFNSLIINFFSKKKKNKMSITIGGSLPLSPHFSVHVYIQHI